MYKYPNYKVKQMSKSPRLNVSTTEETKTEFEHIQNLEGFSTYGETLALLIAAYQELKQINSLELKLTDEENQLVEDAVNLSGMSRNEITKRGLIAEAKKAVSLAKRQSELSEAAPEDLKKMTFRGVAATRIEQIIIRIMEHNDSQPEKQNKFCITESLVFKLTGSNRKAITDYFDSHRILIEDHNQKHQLTNEDNRKGKGIDIKSMLNL